MTHPPTPPAEDARDRTPPEGSTQGRAVTPDSGALPDDLRALESSLNTRGLRLKAVWLVVPLFLWFVEPTRWTLMVGGALGLVGLLVRGWAAGTIRKERELTVSGPYAHTRNPLYLGSLFLGLGITLASGKLIWPVLFLLFYLGIYARTMRGEETFLGELFGDAYRDYRAEVPAFVPRLEPYVGGAVASQGFRWARYGRNREWEAALGFVGVMAYLGVRWWLTL